MKTSSNQSSEASAPIFNTDKHNVKDTSNNNSFSSSSYNEKEEKSQNDKKILKNSKNNFSSNNNIGNTLVHFNCNEVKKNQKKINNACFSELYIAPNKFTICNNKEILKNCDALISSSNTMNQEYRNKIKMHNKMYSNNASLNVSKNPSESSINMHARHNSNRFNEEYNSKKEKLALSPRTR